MAQASSDITKPPRGMPFVDPRTGLLSDAALAWFGNFAQAGGLWQLLAQKDQKGGYAGLDLAGLLKLAEMPNLPAALLLAGALANGMIGTTQAAGDNSTNLATTAYLDRLINAPSGLAGLDANQLLQLLVAVPTPANGKIGAGDAAWTVTGSGGAPAFQNGWVNFGAPNAVCAFRKLPNGQVEIKGLVKNGTINTVIFTLPVGYRPAEARQFPCESNSAYGRFQVSPNGDVGMIQGGNADCSLNCTFYAEQ